MLYPWNKGNFPFLTILLSLDLDVNMLISYPGPWDKATYRQKLVSPSLLRLIWFPVSKQTIRLVSKRKKIFWLNPSPMIWGRGLLADFLIKLEKCAYIYFQHAVWSYYVGTTWFVLSFWHSSLYKKGISIMVSFIFLSFYFCCEWTRYHNLWLAFWVFHVTSLTIEKYICLVHKPHLEVLMKWFEIFNHIALLSGLSFLNFKLSKGQEKEAIICKQPLYRVICVNEVITQWHWSLFSVGLQNFTYMTSLAPNNWWMTFYMAWILNSERTGLSDVLRRKNVFLKRHWGWGEDSLFVFSSTTY